MREAKKFAFDVSIAFFASVVSMFLGFLVTILLGRYLGADNLGLYRMTSTLYGITMLVAAMGIPRAIIKYVAEYKENINGLNQIVSSGVITSLFLGIGFSLLFYLSSGIFSEIFNMPGLSGLLKLLSPSFPFAIVSGVLLGLLNGLREMKKYTVAVIVQSVLMLAISAILIYWGFGVAGVVIGLVLSSVGSCLYLLWVCRGYLDITFRNYIQTTKEVLSFGWKIVAGNAINQINYNADIILIGYFLTAMDIGYYAVALGLSRFFWIIPQAIQKITSPATSEYWAKNNHAALQKMINKSMKYTACILLPIGLVIGFFTRDIITFIFGNEFVYSALSLQILVIGAVILGIIMAIGGSIAGVGRPDIGLKIVCISATTNIALNILLIPNFGIIGAAIATTTSLLVHTCLGLFLTVKVLKAEIDFKWFAKIFGISFLSVLIFIFLLGFIDKYLLGMTILFIYISMIVRFLLTEEDRVYLIELLREIRYALS